MMAVNHLFLSAGLTASLLVAGCTTDAAHRHNGVSFGAGDAIAANTVMQMVDPWPAGVEDTNLQVPADHDQYRKPPREDAGGGETLLSD